MKQNVAAGAVSALRIVRVARGLSQHQLCEAASIARSTLSLLENEHQRPRAGTAERLALALGFPAETLFPSGDPEHNDTRPVDEDRARVTTSAGTGRRAPE